MCDSFLEQLRDGEPAPFFQGGLHACASQFHPVDIHACQGEGIVAHEESEFPEGQVFCLVLLQDGF